MRGKKKFVPEPTPVKRKPLEVRFFEAGKALEEVANEAFQAGYTARGELNPVQLPCQGPELVFRMKLERAPACTDHHPPYCGCIRVGAMSATEVQIRR